MNCSRLCGLIGAGLWFASVAVGSQPPGLELHPVLTNLKKAVSLPLEEAGIVTPTLPDTNLVTLTQITQVRRLSPPEASRGHPVDISGVITLFDPASYLHSLQDETSGIYFDLSRAGSLPSLHSGQKVHVQGFSGPGDYAPIIIVQTVQVLEEDTDFPTAESVTFRKLMNGYFDSQWVLLKGVVRNQWTGTNSSSLALFAGDGLVKVVLPGSAPELHLVDAGVEIQGVCRTIFDDHRRLRGVELEVPSWKQVLVKEPPAQLPFKMPVKSVSDLFQFHADGSELHRARLMGVITLRSRDGSFCLQDASGGIQIHPASSTPVLQVGTMVDIVGFPVLLNKTAVVQEALVLPVRSGIAVQPVEPKPDTSLEDTPQATLIRLRGQVMDHFSHGTEEVLTVRFGQKTIDAVLERRLGLDQLTDFVPGMVIRITGVYFGDLSNSAAIQPFRVALRSANDITIVSRPSWWTPQRTHWGLGALAGILLLALIWVRALRRLVRQRTRELHEEIEHHKRTESMLEAQIAERKRMEGEVTRSHQELLMASRQAGMAEVATSVLHNVGNVLNSVNVSAGVVGDKIRKSKVVNLARAAEMINEHSADLARFFQQDSKGQQLPQYLARLAQHLGEERSSILAELDALRKNIEHLKGIVRMQQTYAKASSSAEPVSPTELVEDALRLNSGALLRHEIRVIREYEPDLPDITVDKHKLLQILVNLICNAKNACEESIQPDKLLKVRIFNGQGLMKISVIDNGVGIAPENLTRIFNHGFTTRKDGHGFGLHSGALAAKEMDGTLVVKSDGPGKGAEFTLEIPVHAKAAGE
jgi:signal transduction histidine kinase